MGKRKYGVFTKTGVKNLIEKTNANNGGKTPLVELAEVLNDAGARTVRGNLFDDHKAGMLCRSLGIRQRRKLSIKKKPTRTYRKKKVAEEKRVEPSLTMAEVVLTHQLLNNQQKIEMLKAILA